MNSLKLILMLLISLNYIGCSQQKESVKTQLGADILIGEKLDLLLGKNMAIVTNHTGLLSDGKHIIDTLTNIDGINIKAMFGPEHGIRGNNSDGTKINDNIDDKTGIPIYSLYGSNYKPTEEMLKDVDIVLFDIQDIGARFYTYISTMYYVLEACAEQNKKLIILDRPNPINGIKVDGPFRHDSLKSFVAIAPIPIMHGMTIGELAMLFNREYLEDTAQLEIIKIKNWERKFYYDDCRLAWINPSPNMPNLETAIIYPGLCLLEGTNISEGRGTYEPFLKFGAPFINSAELIQELSLLDIKGLKLTAAEFTPVKIPNMATWVKHENELCKGIKIEITDRNEVEPVKFGIQLLWALNKLYKDDFQFRNSRIDKLFGNEYLRKMLNDGKSPDEIIAVWQNELNEFKELRKKYLLY